MVSSQPLNRHGHGHALGHIIEDDFVLKEARFDVRRKVNGLEYGVTSVIISLLEKGDLPG